jgi:uncharacterized lipoprotein YddW (UPF0748 family)
VPASPPDIQRELRGLWVATVANIDWPSRPSLSAEAQRAELLDILDRAAATGFNAIVLQIRPASDALYRSGIEPWASLLTGVQGTDPGYDPLEFAVREAHARGLELHAWINPFRAGNRSDSLRLAPNHVYHSARHIVVGYGAQLWLDPGEPAAHDHVLRVVSDIVRRYDIDAVHADDYFYPYQQRDSSGRIIDFPDSASYARSGSQLSRDDWRRSNVDRFIERLSREVHAIRPAMKVGISPFGIWRPGFPAGVTGLDAYATIYADARKWLLEGWVDYLAPQLYWRISAPQQSFPALLDWWLQQNPHGRHVWPGLAAYRVADASSSPFEAAEMASQVQVTRERPGASGHLLYNTTATLRRSSGAVAAQLSPLYTMPAIPPAFPWLDRVAPPAPLVSIAGESLRIAPGAGEQVRWWLVRLRGSRAWTTRLYFVEVQTLQLPSDATLAVINAVDAAGNMSAAVQVARPAAVIR